MGEFCKNITLQLNQTHPLLKFINVNVSSLMNVCRENEVLKLDSTMSHAEAKYSEPMPLIGWYIFIASLIFCIVMLVEIFVVGVYMKQFWVPVNRFSLNAASLTVIAVAMKLPMDLTSPMPGEIDQVAKVGSLGFMCIIMSALTPSLAHMGKTSLVANVSALSILVIMLIVNVGIQIKTRVITHKSFHPFSMPPFMAAYIYMGMLLFLLIIYISSAITIQSLKRVLKLKYQATLIDQNLQENLMFNVEELREFVKRHWIMALTSNSQFVLASTPLYSASCVVCAISMLVYVSLSWHVLTRLTSNASVYKGSTSANYVVQSLGVVGGTFGSIYRCFAVLGFKSTAKQRRNPFSVFKVEKYWTKQLCEWKESLLEDDDMLQRVVLRNLSHRWVIADFLSICISFQRVIVVLCKIMELIPIAVIMFFMYCSYYFKSLKEMLFTSPAASSSEDGEEYLSNYVLLLEDNVQVTKYSVKRILDAMDTWKEKVEGASVRHLLNLIEKSVTFEGVERFDTDQIQSLLPVELVYCWSLPIISLACIATVMPNIDKGVVDNLLTSVREGLPYNLEVETRLNTTSECENIRKATRTLWIEVRQYQNWLGTTLKRSAYEGKTPIEIIKLFAQTSEDIMTEFNRATNGEQVEKEDLPNKVIAANSMYRIAKTIIHTYESNNLEITEDELFSRLSTMIADILTACLTNMPRVIMKYCCKKQLESVWAAYSLLELTSEIIKRLETRELPDMDPDKMGFIDEWRLHFKKP